jgi:signal recognition particle receptor subunit alpha
VNSLIREALIEGRTTDEKYEKDGYSVKWKFVNDLELIFVVRIIFVSERAYMFMTGRPSGGLPAYPTTHIRG